MSTLYENIKFHCDRMGISGAKLCAEADVSKSTLTSLKNGRTKKISTENLSKMAGVLGVTVDELLGSDQKEKPTTSEGSELSKERIQMLLDQMSAADLVELMGDVADALKRRGAE